MTNNCGNNFPAGAAAPPSVQVGATTCGLWNDANFLQINACSSGGLLASNSGTNILYEWTGIGFYGGSGMVLGIASTPAPSSGTLDIAWDRAAAGVWEIDTGTQGTEGGLLRAGLNPCRITSPITLSTSATTICSWSLPPVAKAWAWQCSIGYNVTAGTTPTVAIGVNPSQTPTGSTIGFATIDLTVATLTGSSGSATISASGATNLLTSGTVTTTSTNLPATTFGTLLASGTAGTFAITMTGTGASFAGTATAGSTCWFY